MEKDESVLLLSWWQSTSSGPKLIIDCSLAASTFPVQRTRLYHSVLITMEPC